MRLLTILALLITAFGCGRNLPDLAPVSGTVTYQGKPLEKGTLQLIPREGRSAHGRIEQGQIVEVSTFAPGDGALLGEHRVAVFSFIGTPTGMEAQIPWAIPKRYGNPDNSGLTIQVTADGANNVQLELVD